MGDVAETVTGILPQLDAQLIYFSATKIGAADTVTFSDYRSVLYCAALCAGADDPVTTVVTNVVTFSAGTGALKGFAIVIK